MYGNPSMGEIRLIQANENGVSTSKGYKPIPSTAKVGTTPVAEVSYSGSSAYAIYEVANTDTSLLETATIPVAVAYDTSPGTGQVTVTPSLAPLDATATASESAPLPRFASIYATEPAFAIYKCQASTLSATVADKSGSNDARVWNIQINNKANPSFGTKIESFKLNHASGPKCTAKIVSPSFPVSLGDLPAESSASMPVTIDFTGCASTTKFNVSMPVSANAGTATKTMGIGGQTP